MKAKLKAADWHRMLYNVKLFQTSKSQDPVSMTYSNGRLWTWVSDDYTYLIDSSPCSFTSWDQPERVYYPGEIKDEEMKMRSYESEEIEVEISSTDSGGIDPLGMFAPEELTYDDLAMPSSFGLSPDRFRKLSLIRPGDYPVDLKPAWHTIFETVVLFKAGPTVKGALTTVDREIVKGQHENWEEFLWE